MVKQKRLLFTVIIQLLVLVSACHQPAKTTTSSPPDFVKDTPKKELIHQLKPGIPLDEQTAIEVAEKFIADNGYTDLPPISDTSQLAYESIEWQSDVNQMLQSRHNTLEQKAFSFSDDRHGKKGWTLGFRYKGATEGVGRVSIEEHGRAVTMDTDGGNIRVEHQDVFLKKLKRTLRY